MTLGEGDAIGFVFPGQGSQRVGMGKDLVREHPELLDLYYGPAEEILGIPLSRMCWEGPKDVLRDTAVTQPAIFLTSVCFEHVLRAQGVVPDVVSGHSLGEYSALVAAGVLDWSDALSLVRLRGQLMAAVNERVPGAMAAVVGLAPDLVETLCAAVAEAIGVVIEVANDNEPGQVVVSGQAAGVERLAAVAREAGARRVIPLEVGAPFHCSLMAETEDRFARALRGVRFGEPQCLVVSSVTADVVAGPAQARELLSRQLTARVRWRETVSRMRALGVGRFVEVGPGSVLTGLSRRIEPDLPVYSTSDERGRAGVLRALVPQGE